MIYNDKSHWANMLDKSVWNSGKHWTLDIYQIIDVHRKGKVQWRRNNFSLNRMRKASYGPNDDVMDSATFHEYELKQEQERQN